MILSYRYRLKDRSAKKILRQHAIAVNQVWNYANAVQKRAQDRYAAGSRSKWPSHFDLTYLTSGSSKELGIHAQTVGEVCKQFAKNRDRTKRFCKFRVSFGPKRSLGWIPFRKQSRQVDGNSVSYMGRKFRFFGLSRRPLPENAKGGAFVEDARGRWYVTFQCEVEHKPAGAGQIGIDLGLKTLATCSDGQTVPAMQHYRRYQAALAVAQRAGNRRRVKAIHAKIANARRDQAHKATTKIARENSFIAVGNVSASQLKRTRMAKSISDAGWFTFRQQLEYKASRHQAVCVVADERFTSVTCSECGSLSGPKGQKGLRIRHWDCSECGASHDRDVNAAKNILRVGLSNQPHADESREIA
jgi:putative transposase